MIIHGGKTQTEKFEDIFLDDMWIFNFTRKLWN